MRPVLADIKIEVTPGNLRLIATDSYRLATIDLKATGKRSTSFFLPRRDVISVAKHLRTFDEVALISGDPERAPYVEPDGKNPKHCFLGLDTELTVTRRWGKSPAAKYPDYEKLIPRRAGRKWRLDFGCANSLVEILKGAPKADKADRRVSVRFAPDSEGLRIEWVSSLAVSRPNTISYCRLHPDIAGTPSSVVVDRKYILECLALMDGKPFTVYCHGERSPLDITNGDRSVALMPRLGW